MKLFNYCTHRTVLPKFEEMDMSTTIEPRFTGLWFLRQGGIHKLRGKKSGFFYLPSLPCGHFANEFTPKCRYTKPQFEGFFPKKEKKCLSFWRKIHCSNVKMKYAMNFTSTWWTKIKYAFFHSILKNHWFSSILVYLLISRAHLMVIFFAKQQLFLIIVFYEIELSTK